MSLRRRIAFSVGLALDRSGIPGLAKLVLGGLYTMYKAKDLGAFGSGSTISPFCIFQGARHIRIGSSAHVRAGCHLQAVESYASAPDGGVPPGTPEILIGDRTLIGRFCHITAVRRIEIGQGVLFGEGVLIADHDHRFEDPVAAPRDQPLSPGRPVRIGDNCWLGDHAAILAGVTLGRHVIVGANATVTRDVPDDTVVTGRPARPVSRYDPDRKTWVTLAGAGSAGEDLA